MQLAQYARSGRYGWCVQVMVSPLGLVRWNFHAATDKFASYVLEKYGFLETHCSLKSVHYRVIIIFKDTG